MFSKKCQRKVYDIKLQIITELSIPIKSPINAASNTNLVFFTPTTLVYTAIVYSVVSVEPIIVDVINPNFTINTILSHNITTYGNRRTTEKQVLALQVAKFPWEY